MKENECHDEVERRQLEFIQRVGRVGYWEYDPAQRLISLPQASQVLLNSIIESVPDSARTLVEVMSECERSRFQGALDLAVAQRLELNMELQLTRSDSQASYLVVRAVPQETERGAPTLAGSFRDVTQEKRRAAEHEKLSTQLQALLDALPQGVSVIDKELQLILWNQRFHEILQFPQQMVYRNARFEDFIRLNATRGEYGPGDAEAQVQLIVARAREFLPHRFERQLTGGRTLLVEGYPFRCGGEISGFVTTYTDITEQRLTEEQLTRQRDMMSTIVDNFPGGISLCDTDLKFTTYNDKFRELLDFPASMFDKGWVAFEDLARFNANRGEYGPGDAQEQVQVVVERARNFEAHQIERLRPNGRWLEIRGTPIASGGFVTSYIDITERKQMEEQVRQLAFHDPLTQLPNRRLLSDRLSQALAASRRNACYGAVMVLDLDNFKPLNDQHGHLVGDLLLIEAARRLNACVREMDTVARFGGDEFVVLLSELAGAAQPASVQAGVIAEKIRSTLSEPYRLSLSHGVQGETTVEHHCSASIGVVVFGGDESRHDEVLKWADAAMYQAKDAGRNLIRLHAS